MWENGSISEAELVNAIKDTLEKTLQAADSLMGIAYGLARITEHLAGGKRVN